LSAAAVPEKKQFPALTGIRALGMYMVFLAHYNPFQTAPDGFAARFINECYVGLIMFFVLSGFLITYRYKDQPARSLRSYLVNRVARVYPMYFLLTTLTLLVAADRMGDVGGDLPAWKVYLANVTFVRGFFADLLFSGVSQGWSLTPEEVFYLTAPLTFVLLNRSRLTLIIVPLCLLATGFLLVRLFGGGGAFGFMANNEFMRTYTIFGVSATFYAGVALAVAYARYGDRFRGRYLTLIGGTVTLGIMVAAAILKGDATVAVSHPLGYAVMTAILPTFGIAVLMWGLMIEDTWLSALLGSRLAVLLGHCSLTFYLLHVGVVADFLLSLWPNYAVLCLAMTVISVVVSLAIEHPADRAIRRFGRSRSQRAAVAGS
jgi:peptidoglycan/LPS O-acetylase OafA/YrhL